MELMEVISNVIEVGLNLVLCWLLVLSIEQWQLIREAVGVQKKKAIRQKKETKKGEKKKEEKKPGRAELEEQVRQMFPERPEPDEGSRAREVVVKLLQKSARGIFELLPEEVCVTILVKIAGAGEGCPRCGEKEELGEKEGGYRKHYHRQKCQKCVREGRTATFYELTGTIFEGSHLAARQWLWGMFLFVSGCSTREIAKELGVKLETGQRLVTLMQLSLMTQRHRFMLTGTVEFDEVYIIGGLKGQAGQLKLERAPRQRGYRQPGRGTWDSDKTPILGLVDRSGQIYLVPCANVQSQTIQPLIEYLTDKGATLYTDEYNIYNFLVRVGYQHHTVNHSQKEYARGQVHVNTVEGLWSLLRDHLRIHRGVSKLYLPLYVMRFEFLVNHRQESRWEQMLALCGLACQADGVELRRLVRDKQVHTACPILGLGQTA